MSISTSEEPAPQILVAEDNEANRTLMVEALELFGFVPTTVTNGKQALDALRERHYDLVLMDCRMPEMDGFDATRHFRALEEQTRQPRTPVVALTANAMAGDRERCIQAGMDDYITKPFELLELKSVVERLIKGD